MKTGLKPEWQRALAPAKINWFLEVRNRRSDGFHELETVISAIDLCDELYFLPRADEQIRLRVIPMVRDATCIPSDHRNLVVRAVELLRDQFKTARHVGIDIVLVKRIPSQAGLGGGSSDAVATLQVLNRMWNLKLSTTRLLELAAQLGSDVPFFVHGGTAVCRGRGEWVTPLDVAAGIPLVIVKPTVGLATASVFQSLELPTRPVGIERIVTSLKAGHRNQVSQLLFNRLEAAATQLQPAIQELSEQFELMNCLGHQMSGSGTSYFGVFATHRLARRAARNLSNRLPNATIFFSQTLGRDPAGSVIRGLAA